MKNKNFLKHLKKGISYSVVGSIGFAVVATLSGCGEKQEEKKEAQVFNDVSKAQNTFFVIEEKPVGNFTVLEKHPTSGPTRAIIRDENGTERMLNEEEIKKLAQDEAQKVENGTSNLVNQNTQQANGGGLSLGEAILAGAGGALLGSLVGNMIANKLMNNDRFQQSQRQANMQRPSISRSITPTTPTTSKPATPKSNFFGGSNTASTTSSATTTKPTTSSSTALKPATTTSSTPKSGYFGSSSSSSSKSNNYSSSSSSSSFGG